GLVDVGRTFRPGMIARNPLYTEAIERQIGELHRLGGTIVSSCPAVVSSHDFKAPSISAHAWRSSPFPQILLADVSWTSAPGTAGSASKWKNAGLKWWPSTRPSIPVSGRS